MAVSMSKPGSTPEPPKDSDNGLPAAPRNPYEARSVVLGAGGSITPDGVPVIPLFEAPIDPATAMLRAYERLFRQIPLPLVMLPLPADMFGVSSDASLAPVVSLYPLSSASILGSVAGVSNDPSKGAFASLKAFRQGAMAARMHGLRSGSSNRGIDKRLQLVRSTPASITTPQPPITALSPEAAGQLLDRLAGYATGDPSDPVTSTDETDDAS